jgi:hypothetical protein
LCAASASIIVSVGTRLQCPPVYGLLSSMAVLMSSISDSNRHLELLDEQPVGERDRGLRGERLGEALVLLAELDHLPDAGSVAFSSCSTPMMSPSWSFIGTVRNDGRAVAGALVEVARAREVEALLGVGVGDVDGLVGERGVGRDHRVVGLAVGPVQRDRGRTAPALPELPAHGDRQAVGAHDLELQLAAHQAVERARRRRA